MSLCSPVSVQMQVSPEGSDGAVPRVVLKLKYPSPAHESDACPPVNNSVAQPPQSEVADLKKQLADCRATISQLRSSLRSALMNQRMLGAQARENTRRVRKELASMRAACWQEMGAFKQAHKQTE
eukprot:2597063-Pleurochrysis_carterae.AAC.1